MSKQAKDPFAPPPRPELIISHGKVFFNEQEEVVFCEPAQKDDNKRRKGFNGYEFKAYVEIEFDIDGFDDIHVERWFKVCESPEKTE